MDRSDYFYDDWVWGCGAEIFLWEDVCVVDGGVGDCGVGGFGGVDDG